MTRTWMRPALALLIAGWFFPGSETVFLYDADEAQSGLYFNLEPSSMGGFTKIDPAA